MSIGQQSVKLLKKTLQRINSPQLSSPVDPNELFEDLSPSLLHCEMRLIEIMLSSPLRLTIREVSYNGQ